MVSDEEKKRALRPHQFVLMPSRALYGFGLISGETGFTDQLLS